MPINRRQSLSLLAALSLYMPVWAQGFPVRPIRLVVPFPPGGPTDLVGRLLAQKLGDALGQPVVVENRAGAGGTVGAEVVAKAPADGYTLLYGSTSTLAISPSIYKSLSYNPAKAFQPIALVSRGTQVLVVNPQVPVKNLKELVEYSIKNPDKLSYSSAGNGTPGHLGTEFLKSLTGMRAAHIPYKGGSPALNAVLSGEVQFTVDVVPTSLQFVQTGKLRALAVLSAKRSDQMREVPTVRDAGFKEVNADFWSGLVAPAGTPLGLIRRLNEEVQKITATADFKEKLAVGGAQSQATTVAEFATYIDGEMKKWAAIAQSANVKAD